MNVFFYVFFDIQVRFSFSFYCWIESMSMECICFIITRDVYARFVRTVLARCNMKKEMK